MDGLKVLITNNTLKHRSGSELYVRDLATGLLALGHKPICFSTVLGDVARELRAATIAVIDNLDLMSSPPDIIHGQHHIDAMIAMLHFPDTPAIYFCHGWLPWEEAPPRFPRIMKYIAVDETCRDRLVFENGVPEDEVRVLLNFVDLVRFTARGPLPARPKRALVLSNNASEETQLNAAREACRQHGIALDVIGLGSGEICAKPEAVLADYDLVFAKARSALEAMAVGAAVILCDAAGVGGMVTSDEFDRLRRLNFGIRTLRKPVSSEVLAREIARYDARDAKAVSARVRASAGRESVVDELVKIYKDAIANFKELKRDLATEQRAASDYLRWLSPILKNHVDAWHARTQEDDRVRQDLERLLALREAELGNIKQTLGWRLLSHYGPIKYRFLIPAYKQLRRLLPGNNRLTQNKDSALDL